MFAITFSTKIPVLLAQNQPKMHAAPEPQILQPAFLHFDCDYLL
jgi:hypothetical protein